MCSMTRIAFNWTFLVSRYGLRVVITALSFLEKVDISARPAFGFFGTTQLDRLPEICVRGLTALLLFCFGSRVFWFR